jgi:hypothetical protein
VEADVVGTRTGSGVRVFAKMRLLPCVNATEIKSSSTTFDTTFMAALPFSVIKPIR